MSKPDSGAEPALRLDKWLWYARFAKTRSRATKLCTSGEVRLDGEPVTKANQSVRPGAVLSFPQGHHLRIVRVVALAERRGPAPEAQTLYEDLKPPTRENKVPPPLMKGPRPTKKDRRQLERILGRGSEG